MRGPGRPDIVNAGSGESGYSECGVRGDRNNSDLLVVGERGYSEYGVRAGRRDIVNAGSGETRYSECWGWGRPDIVMRGRGGDTNIVNAGGPGWTRYSECRFWWWFK
ncbi:unnamed protein product, partial [Staurois parvus]